MTRILLFCFLIISFFSFSQTLNIKHNWCNSIEMMNKYFVQHPEQKRIFDSTQNVLNNISGNSFSKSATVNYTVPVVFHILHTYGYENISDAQVQDAVAILNRDFNLQNADTSVVIAPMKNAIGNVHFNFVLAKKDPNGNCTSGINRYVDANTNNWHGDYQDYLYTWDPTMYLNFYVVKVIDGNAAGYAYYPGSLGTGSPMDAIVILSNYVGSIGTSNANLSRALTHEVGHWFNLQHVWGNTNNPGVACGNDAVFDTPITKGYTACSNLLSSQICTPGVSENYQNYMDYSYCCVMFTNGQATRMNTAANSSTGGRDNLGSVTNLSLTGISPLAQCPPTALFSSNKQIICAGQSITYTDLSNVSAPTSWQWIFEGGTPNVSSVQNPTVTYNTPGTYSVQLISSNSMGNSTPEVKTGYVTVLQNAISTSINEGFESITLQNSNWILKTQSGNNTNWQQTNLAAATGSVSAIVSESVSPVSTVELITPPINFTQIPSPTLSFKWAAAEKDSTTHSSFDVFSIYVSTNCGASWSPRFSRNIRYNVTGVSDVVNGGFIPTTSQFNQETINLASYGSYSNVLVKFRLQTETGSSNNFYLDDINIFSSVTGINAIDNFDSKINLFPNPAKDVLFIRFNLNEISNVAIDLCNVLGQTVKHIETNIATKDEKQISVPLNEMSKGVYFVKLKIKDIVYTKKIVID